MFTLRHKIWADLWLDKSRTLLAISSLAVGVFCVGTLFGMIDLLLGRMDAAHRESQPSHINLILRDDAGMELADRMRSIDGVAGIDTMTQLTVRYRLPGTSRWDSGTLIIRPDYAAQRFDKTELRSGEWPDADTLAVERLSAIAASLVIGDRIELDTPKGAKTLAIGGIVRHPFVKPPRFGGQIHFFASPSLYPELGLAPNTFRQALVRVTPPFSADKAHAVAREIRGLLAEHRVGVGATLLQDPGKHWGRPILAGVNAVLQIMAIVSLVLASVLILNTLSAHIAQQTDQIGVMKALGGRARTIAGLYLSETLLLAVAAIALAAPAGLAAAHTASCRLLNLFNIDCSSFAVSRRALWVMLLGGLLAPLLAALVPVLRGAGMTVRAAIASYGLGSQFGSRRFDVWVECFGAIFLSTLYAAALGNLFRRRGRLWLTQGVLVISGLMFLVLTSLIASVDLTLDNEAARSRYALRLGFVDDKSERKVRELAGPVTGAGRIETWLRLPAELAREGLPVRHQGSLGAQLLALPAATAMYRPLIEKGRWLQAADSGRRVVVLNADTARLNGIEVGEKLALRFGNEAGDWTVVGLYRWLAGSAYAVEPVYAPLETLIEITRRPDAASFLLIEADLATEQEEASVFGAIKQTFEDAGIRLDVYSTQARLEQRRFIRNQFNPMIWTLTGLASMIAAVAGIGLSGTISIGVLQRTREIGVLRAIGAPSRAVLRMFMLEGVLYGFGAWLLSVPLAYLAAEPAARKLGETMLGIRLDFAFDWVSVAYWLGIVLALACAASWWPARKASRLTVLECLGH